MHRHQSYSLTSTSNISSTRPPRDSAQAMAPKEEVTEPLIAVVTQQQPSIQEARHEGKVIPVQLETIKLNYYLGVKESHILKDVSITFSPGLLTAVMGPSGAGKTTLLNTLIGNAGGRIEGEVMINGRTLKEVASRFKKLYTFVPQDDTLLPSLTPRETLTFAAKLRLPMSLKVREKRQHVADVLEELSLSRCADRRIGDVDRRGISGGERKRTSIALELLVNPSVMFVDEPTSGLDAKMAEDVVLTLKRLAQQGRTLICTIHQPSYKIFRLFDRLVLLSLGSTVYNGPVERVESYFSSFGFDTPRGENPADYLMRVLQLRPDEVDENGRAGRSDLPTLWKEKAIEYEKTHEEEAPSSAAASGLLITTGNGSSSMSTLVFGGGGDSGYIMEDLKSMDLGYSTPKWYQTWVLFHRSLLDSVKDRDKFLGGLALKASVGLLVGIVWLNQGESALQSSIFPISGALFIATTSSVLDTLFGCVLTFPTMKTLLLREYKNGYYSLTPFYIATLGSAIVFNAFYAIFLATPIFFLVGDTHHAAMLGAPFSAEKYFLFLALLALLATIGAALGLMVGALVKDIQSAQQAVMPTVIPLLLFSGYLIPYHQIPSYFKWLYHCSPFAYAMAALQITLFRDVTFTDCGPPPCPNVCYGGRTLCFSTGVDYLHSVNANPDEIGRSFGLLAVIFTVLFIGGFTTMSILVRKKTN